MALMAPLPTLAWDHTPQPLQDPLLLLLLLLLLLPRSRAEHELGFFNFVFL
jgi:hypothetical protein